MEIGTDMNRFPPPGIWPPGPAWPSASVNRWEERQGPGRAPHSLGHLGDKRAIVSDARRGSGPDTRTLNPLRLRGRAERVVILPPPSLEVVGRCPASISAVSTETGRFISRGKTAVTAACSEQLPPVEYGLPDPLNLPRPEFTLEDTWALHLT